MFDASGHVEHMHGLHPRQQSRTLLSCDTLHFMVRTAERLKVPLVAVALNMEPKKFASPSARNSCTTQSEQHGPCNHTRVRPRTGLLEAQCASPAAPAASLPHTTVCSADNKPKGDSTLISEACLFGLQVVAIDGGEVGANCAGVQQRHDRRNESRDDHLHVTRQAAAFRTSAEVRESRCNDDIMQWDETTVYAARRIAGSSATRAKAHGL
jgi:hypothetical protein